MNATFKRFAKNIRRWRSDCVAFAREFLRIEHLDAWQVKVLSRVPAGGRISLKASKGPGKTFVLGIVGWWFLVCFPHPKVAATSISGDNLKDGLWTEMAKLQGAVPALKASFTWTAERIFCNDHRETWWMSARTWPKDADSTKQADTLAGLHADNLAFIIDEAGGVPDAVAAAAEAAIGTEGGFKLFLIAGNPTELSGPLYRASTIERHLWWVYEISGDPDDPERAPRVSIQWAREQIQKYGRDNPWVLVNVFGQFPPGQSNALLGVEEVGAAAKRILPRDEHMHLPRLLGVDVARFGDDRTVFAARQGRALLSLKTFRNLSTMEVAGQVALSIAKWQPDAVFVDATGIGAGVVDRLQELGHAVIGVDFGSKAMKPEPKLANRRAEMWWDMADWVKGGGCIPDDPELRAELVAPTYSFDPSGRLKLESKDDMKKRGLPSPDKADALALTFAMPVPTLTDIERAALKAGGSRHHAATDYDPFAEGRA